MGRRVWEEILGREENCGAEGAYREEAGTGGKREGGGAEGAGRKRKEEEGRAPGGRGRQEEEEVGGRGAQCGANGGGASMVLKHTVTINKNVYTKKSTYRRARLELEVFLWAQGSPGVYLYWV